jgi:hypothetical protein
MLKETIKLVLLILGALTLTLGPVFLHVLAKRRRTVQRRSLGLPPEKRRTSPLAWLFLGCLIFGAVVMVTDVADMVAKDNVKAANDTAKYLYWQAEEYCRDAEPSDCVTVIAQFSETNTPLKAHMHKLAEEYDKFRDEDWYAVVFRSGRLEFALWSGNPITPDDLHETDFDAEKNKVKWQGHTYRDAIGYYRTEKRPGG